jgi:hypothetical protein
MPRGTISFTAFCQRVLCFSLTRGQRVMSLIAFDGKDPIDLIDPYERALALEMFGGAERIPKSARGIIALRCGRRGGKTILSSAFGIYKMVTADLSHAGPGDIPASIIVARDTEQASIAFKDALALVKQSPQLCDQIVRERGKDFTLRRWDDREVSFVVKAKAGGGSSARGYSPVAFTLDESEFVSTSNINAVVNDRDIISGVMPALRIMGGSCILSSTPWPAQSETSKLFDFNYGRPTTAVAALVTTLTLRDNAPQWVAIVEGERARDPRNAAREYDCQIVDAEGLFFEALKIQSAVTQAVPNLQLRATAGIDLAFSGDSSALVVIQRQDTKVVVLHCSMRSPTPKKPLVPSEVLLQFAKEAKAFGCREFAADSHYIETAREIARNNGLTVVAGPRGAKDILRAYMYVRDLLREDKLLLPDDPKLLGQLKSVMQQPHSGGGLSVVLPRNQGSGHADLVSALVAAVWHDRRFGSLTGETLAYQAFQSPSPRDGVYTSNPKTAEAARDFYTDSPLPQRGGGFQRW